MLALAARHGPWVLVGGLVAGLALPGIAAQLTPWLPQLVMALLLVSMLQIAPRDLAGSLAALPGVAATALALQLALPLAIMGTAALGGWLASPQVLALVLMSAAPSIVGSPNICAMMGAGPLPALRLMVTGTVLLPLSVLPVLWLHPALDEAAAILRAVGRLSLTIFATAAVAMVLRVTLLPRPSAAVLTRLRGASAIALAVFVVALMPPLARVFAAAPLTALGWLALALAANFGLQLAGRAYARPRMPRDTATALGVIAGNRNIALFLVALPPETTAPVIVFIACYQIPMYLTPMLMRRFY